MAITNRLTSGFKTSLYCTVAMSTVLGLVGAAEAQTAPPSPPETGANVEEVVVTGSRIQREGFVAPTPVTALTKDELEVGGRASIGTALADLPAMRGSLSQTSTTGLTGRQGVNVADLRGLGSTRTLTLVDGRRPVLTNATDFNLNVIPISLVERVDVVTGGASAAYGSDAVSGVVNIILNNRLEGVRTSVQYGSPTAGNGGEEFKADLAFGASFANDRGHLIAGAQYVDRKPQGPKASNDALRYGFIANPAYTPTNGQPQQLLVKDIGFVNEAAGGLIVSGPLAGTKFGPEGVPQPFVYGQYRGSSFMAGGDPDANITNNYTQISTQATEQNAYGRLQYDVLDNVKLVADGYYSNVRNSGLIRPDGNPNPLAGLITIQQDNPFLPASILAQMTSAGITSFQMGRTNDDFALMKNRLAMDSYQGTVGLQGSFGENNWSWDTFYSYGRSTVNAQLFNEKIRDLFAQSVDAVRSPTTGQPICRIALTVPTTACVPINLFGKGSPSAAAAAYVLGVNQSVSTLNQQEFSATIHGEPLSLWAGPVSVAAGGEWRRYSLNVVADPISLANRFDGLNSTNLAGSYSVAEGFVETLIPLARDLPLLKALDFNGAVRVSDYSNAGTFTSWKVGFTDTITDELRLRGTASRDIRAPNISELYAQNTINIVTITDPANNHQSSATSVGGGNANLSAETARTNTIGLVYQPKWLSGLSVSVDWYDIKISGAISALSPQNIVNSCFNGNTALCSNITRDATGAITQVFSGNINLSTLKTSGLDIEVSDNLTLSDVLPSVPGHLTSRLLVGWVDKLTTFDGITRVEMAGNVQTGVAHWRASLSETYVLDRVQINVRARFLGAGVRSTTITNDSNHVGSVVYVDVGGQYALRPDSNLVVFANLVNALDRKPPKNPNLALYDVVGRAFNVGLRYSF